MTVILPFGRSLTRHLVPKSNHLLTRLTSTNPLLRVSYCNPDDTSNSESCRSALATKSVVCTVRSYATSATPRSTGRPKAHTGRTVARKTTANAAKTVKSASTKKSSTKKVTPKAKAKTKAKAKSKPRATKKTLSPTAIKNAQSARTRDLKARALLTEPKQLPTGAWIVYTSQNQGYGPSFAETGAKVKELAQEYKHLSLEEREQLNHTVNQNKAKNELEYKKWVSQFTPTEIRDANNARKTLNREKKAKEGKERAPIRLIKDDRQVKRPKGAFTLFNVERFASGDFKHMAITEAVKLSSREWKALSAAEKKPYMDRHEAEKTRYIEEVRTVYGTEPAVKKPGKTT